MLRLAIGDLEPVVEESRAETDRDRQPIRGNARPDATSYHLLLSLRRNAPNAYEQIPPATRAAVLTDALRTLPNLNDFGHLGPGGGYDGPAAKPLIEIGEPAIEPLTALLSDERPAPLMGSEEATLSHDHGYRRSDFAFRYLSEILGRDPQLPQVQPGRTTRIRKVEPLRAGFAIATSAAGRAATRRSCRRTTLWRIFGGLPA